MRSPLVDVGFTYLFSLPRPIRIRIWEWADIMGRSEFDWRWDGDHMTSRVFANRILTAGL